MEIPRICILEEFLVSLAFFCQLYVLIQIRVKNQRQRIAVVVFGGIGGSIGVVVYKLPTRFWHEKCHFWANICLAAVRLKRFREPVRFKLWKFNSNQGFKSEIVNPALSCLLAHCRNFATVMVFVLKAPLLQVSYFSIVFPQ